MSGLSLPWQVRHCALSLVGEPIMYPEINALIAELHSRGISSFLVTNAQFPDRIRCEASRQQALHWHCTP
jgi:wyosine [tRNA(Phe)-imidazoG37] synthetase (radical SAM superfamily)